MNLYERTDAFIVLGNYINSLLKGNSVSKKNIYNRLLKNAHDENAWFDKRHVRFALRQTALSLKKERISKWLKPYDVHKLDASVSQKVAVIMAGNIPLVGFHDFLCVLLSGYQILIKTSSQDSVLIKHLSKELCRINPIFKTKIRFCTLEDLNQAHVVIATGSDNTARYFESHWGHLPKVIRKNRKSIAVLSGLEDDKALKRLSKDICLYYNRGCRSISQLFIPKDYTLDKLSDILSRFSYLLKNKKYKNNYLYSKALLTVDNEEFTDTGTVILANSTSYQSLGIVNYSFYNTIDEVNQYIETNKETIQCVVSDKELILDAIPFGKAQSPQLLDYADGIDTLSFLLAHKK